MFNRIDKDIRPFRFWCQKVLPLVYDDSLSYYELLCKVVKYLNNMIEDFRQMNQEIEDFERQFIELKNYVDNYFDSTDFQAMVNNKLDEMAESGFFDDIFDRYVDSEEFNEKVRVIAEEEVIDYTDSDDFKSKIRDSFITGAGNNLYGNLRVFPDRYKDSDGEYSAQSFASDGTYYYIFWNRYNKSALSKYNISDGRLVDTITGTWYHGNGMGVDTQNKLLYTNDCMVYNNPPDSSDISYNGIIRVFDTESFTYQGEINTDLDSITSVCFYGGILYAFSNKKLYSVDTETGNTTLVLTLGTVSNIGTTQSVFIDDKYLYWARSFPNIIQVYSLETGNQYTVLNIGTKIKGASVVNELEGVCIRGNNIYLLDGTGRIFLITNKGNATQSLYGRQGIGRVELYVSGLENTPSRMFSGVYKTLQNAVDYLKSVDFIRATIHIDNVGDSNTDNCTFESINGQITIDCHNTIMKGEYYIYDGQISFINGVYDLNNLTTHKWTISNYYKQYVCLVIQGEYTGYTTDCYVVYTRGQCSGFINVQGTANAQTLANNKCWIAGNVVVKTDIGFTIEGKVGGVYQHEYYLDNFGGEILPFNKVSIKPNVSFTPSNNGEVNIDLTNYGGSVFQWGVPFSVNIGSIGAVNFLKTSEHLFAPVVITDRNHGKLFTLTATYNSTTKVLNLKLRVINSYNGGDITTDTITETYPITSIEFGM